MIADLKTDMPNRSAAVRRLIQINLDGQTHKTERRAHRRKAKQRTGKGRSQRARDRN